MGQATAVFKRAKREVEERASTAARIRALILEELRTGEKIPVDEFVADVARELEVGEGSVQRIVWSLVQSGELVLGDKFEVSRRDSGVAD